MLTLAHPERTPGESAAGAAPADPMATLQELPHIRVGRISLDERVDTSAADVATIRRLYTDAVGVAQTLWDLTQREGQPDPGEARELIDNLAQAVAQNRTALVALTALKEYDNYTFTHMVNVSILTMAQARALSVEGGLLREFGLAALMHDIGKVRTPIELLHKPDKLTDREFEVVRMHVVDGAEILRRTPDMPALAPVVAFEHHLRLDGTGYPVGVTRSKLNLGTMLCSIADVYDAMRSQRAYQEVVPDRSHHLGPEAQRRPAVRPASRPPVLAADGHLSAREHGAPRHRRNRRRLADLCARPASAARASGRRRRRREARPAARRQSLGKYRDVAGTTGYPVAGRSANARHRPADLLCES